jgi:tRNA pseudouridine38-40 synthase
MRTLDELTIIRQEERLIVHAKARSFLHHQVRNMVGSLKMVGEGRWPDSRVGDVLEAKNRALAGPTAPPDGLYLVSIGYETDLLLT